MTKFAKSRSDSEIVSQLGPSRFAAIEGFLAAGDYKSDHESDFQGAFEAYEEAWKLLATRTSRSVAGSRILSGIAEFAAKSGQAALQTRARKMITTHNIEMAQKNL